MQHLMKATFVLGQRDGQMSHLYGSGFQPSGAQLPFIRQIFYEVPFAVLKRIS